MKHIKLPFTIQLEDKYSDINIENFLYDWQEKKEQIRERIVSMDNALHVELSKFKTYDIDISELIDVGMRYALAKREFRNMMAQVIHYKKEHK